MLIKTSKGRSYSKWTENKVKDSCMQGLEYSIGINMKYFIGEYEL